MSASPKIVVHWLENSRSQRILWLLEELNLHYEIKQYKREKTMLADPALAQIHPLGKSPVITVEQEGETEVIAESGAIVEYLIETFGNGRLAAKEVKKDRSKYLYWLHFAEGTAMLPLIFSIVFAQMPKQAPFFARPLVSFIAGQVMGVYVRPKLRENFKFIEASLEGREFFVGNELSGADIMMIFPIEGLGPAFGYEKYPNISRWLASMKARSAYQKSEERGGKLDMQAFL